MRTLLCAVLLFAGAQSLAATPAAQPTEASVRELFAAMKISNVSQSYAQQLDDAVGASIQQALANEPLNDRQRQILEDSGHKIVRMVSDEMNWAALEPQMLGVYRSTFTQSEVDGMLRFYRSPTGQAVVDKLPATMQQMTQLAQQRFQALLPRIKQVQSDTLAQVRAAADPAASPGVPALSTPNPTPAPPPK
jgi:uncharacterized protein